MLPYYLRAVKIKYYKLKIFCTIDVALIRIFWKRAPGMQRLAAVPLSVKPKMKTFESCPKSYPNVQKMQKYSQRKLVKMENYTA